MSTPPIKPGDKVVYDAQPPSSAPVHPAWAARRTRPSLVTEVFAPAFGEQEARLFDADASFTDAREWFASVDSLRVVEHAVYMRSVSLDTAHALIITTARTGPDPQPEESEPCWCPIGRDHGWEEMPQTRRALREQAERIEHAIRTMPGSGDGDWYEGYLQARTDAADVALGFARRSS